MAVTIHQIETEDELAAWIDNADSAEYVALAEGSPWLLFADETGEWHATRAPYEDDILEDGTYPPGVTVHLETLELPFTIVHIDPVAPSNPRAATAEPAPIYVVGQPVREQGWCGSHFDEIEVDPSHGYFHTRDAAQRYIDELDAPAKARYQERKAAYETSLAAWKLKTDQARAQGYANPDRHPRKPAKPDDHVVIEIKGQASQ